MKFLPPDLENAMELSASDPNQAAEVLRIAAKYLRGQERMPDALAHYLADAFERAMKRVSFVRGSELLINLNLKVTHRRTTANLPKGEAILRVGEKYSISVATVKRMYGKYQAFKASEAEADSLLYQELQSEYTVPSVTSKKPKK